MTDKPDNPAAYPAWICAPCGNRYGKPRGQYATFHEGDACGWCGEETITTEPRDYCYPPMRTERNRHG